MVQITIHMKIIQINNLVCDSYKLKKTAVKHMIVRTNGKFAGLIGVGVSKRY